MKTRPAAPANFPLIRRPQRQRRLARAAWAVVTLALWITYGYLASPLLDADLWDSRDPRDWWLQHRRDFTTSWMLAVCATGASLLLVAWAELDGLRQRRRPRPRLPDVHANAIAQRLHASRTLQRQLSHGKIVYLHLDDAARPIRAETRPLSLPASRKTSMPRMRKHRQ